jgi:CheY-like chemotaxis protein
MKVLIVEDNSDLGQLWLSHLTRLGHSVTLVADADAAIEMLGDDGADVIIADLDLPAAAAASVADYAAYRLPETRVIFVTASTFFSDGSAFAIAANACACLPTQTAPEDLAAVVEYHGPRAAKGT